MAGLCSIYRRGCSVPNLVPAHHMLFRVVPAFTALRKRHVPLRCRFKQRRFRPPFCCLTRDSRRTRFRVHTIRRHQKGCYLSIPAQHPRQATATEAARVRDLQRRRRLFRSTDNTHTHVRPLFRAASVFPRVSPHPFRLRVVPFRVGVREARSTRTRR